jgi:hypothetical protein
MGVHHRRRLLGVVGLIVGDYHREIGMIGFR